jgi:hypothetical protein
VSPRAARHDRPAPKVPLWCGPDDCGFPGEAYPDSRQHRFPPPKGTPSVTCRIGRCDWTCLDRPYRHAHSPRKRVFVPHQSPDDYERAGLAPSPESFE